MNVKVLNSSGKEAKSLKVEAEVFGCDWNAHLVYLACKARRANERQGTHATKTKGMVSGGGKKPFKQKGTGEARQGSTRSPLNPGGGVIHGPQPRDYTEKLNKSSQRQALRVALSDRMKTGKLVVVDQLPVQKYSTKTVLNFLNTFKLGGTTLLADERKDDILYRSARNIKGVTVLRPCDISAYDVVAHGNIVLTESAVKTLTDRLKAE